MAILIQDDRHVLSLNITYSLKWRRMDQKIILSIKHMEFDQV